MKKDILSNYGPDRASSRRASCCGGVMMEDKRDVNRYAPPVGPMGITHNSVGLGGSMIGRAGAQGQRSNSGGASSSGAPGIGGMNHGNAGTQGRR